MFSTYRDYIRENNVDKIKELLEQGWDPSVDDNWLIQEVVDCGYLELVRLLLKDSRVDPSVNDNYCIYCACRNNYIEIVKLLLPDKRVDPSADYNVAIIRTTSTEIIKLLLQDNRVKISDIKKSRWLFNKDHFNRIIKLNRVLKLEKLLQYDLWRLYYRE